MAQNTWINATADKSASRKGDGDHIHTVSGGTSASGDLTVSFDNTVVTTLSLYDSLMRAARLRAIGAGLK